MWQRETWNESVFFWYLDGRTCSSWFLHIIADGASGSQHTCNWLSENLLFSNRPTAKLSRAVAGNKAYDDLTSPSCGWLNSSILITTATFCWLQLSIGGDLTFGVPPEYQPSDVDSVSVHVTGFLLRQETWLIPPLFPPYPLFPNNDDGDSGSMGGGEFQISILLSVLGGFKRKMNGPYWNVLQATNETLIWPPLLTNRCTGVLSFLSSTHQAFLHLVI